MQPSPSRLPFAALDRSSTKSRDRNAADEPSFSRDHNRMIGTVRYWTVIPAWMQYNWVRGWAIAAVLVGAVPAGFNWSVHEEIVCRVLSRIDRSGVGGSAVGGAEYDA